MKLHSAAIKEQALELGFDKVGIVAATALTDEAENLREWLSRGLHGQMSYMARDPQQRSDPRLLMPSAKSVVCVALNYFQPGKHSDDPEIGRISRYAWGDDYHEVLRDKLNALLAWIIAQEPAVEGKICVDTSPMMDKAWAARAGLGWIGKHTNLISKELGSWLFLGELLLSIELEVENYIEPDHCGKCTACLDACPTGAIIAPYQLDATRCISYGTIELRDPELPEVIGDHLENWVFGCDICQDVCPWSRFSKETTEDRFTARPGIIEPRLQELIAMSQEDFSTTFRKSAIKRAKLSGLQRNARAAKLRNARKQ
jgi:epoxyqueuosine reductase